MSEKRSPGEIAVVCACARSNLKDLPMNTRSPHGLLAFTLIELLTVITIIAILMGLLFPVLGIVKDRARMAEARNDVLNIVAALNSYSAEYAKLPPLTASDSGSTSQNGGTQDVFIGDPAAGAKDVNSKLFNILRAIPEDPNTGDKLNPRRIVFFQTKSVSDPNNPRAGFLDRVGGTSGGNKGSLYDPWGKQYNIKAVDTFRRLV